MSRRRPKKKSKPREPSALELLGDIRDVLLELLSLSCCEACSGTGRAHVETKPDGQRVFGTCECRRRAAVTLGDFGVEGFEEVEAPADEGAESDVEDSATAR